MIQFYYDFMVPFIGHNNFQLMNMDTDSLYFACSRPTLDQCVQQADRAKYLEAKQRWLVCDPAVDGRTPGPFKVSVIDSGTGRGWGISLLLFLYI